MIRKSELELHAMAKALFESENMGRVWNIPTNAPSKPYRYAGLMERQNYLARVRDQMRQEEKEVDESGLSNDLS